MSQKHPANFVLTSRPAGYDIHPSNLGHTPIPREFQKFRQSIQ